MVLVFPLDPCQFSNLIAVIMTIPFQSSVQSCGFFGNQKSGNKGAPVHQCFFSHFPVFSSCGSTTSVEQMLSLCLIIYGRRNISVFEPMYSFIIQNNL